ncbi:hypothetical protein LWI29_005134 [Acer saccharum]|uniref:Uncharacterized protein n=1 Tax=Acer saccharum TaxID=4024 RepID=A0AA39VJS8_ACESA|nr:hypothetical protein LWI29_005134 [Acer saccharum]
MKFQLNSGNLFCYWKFVYVHFRTAAYTRRATLHQASPSPFFFFSFVLSCKYKLNNSTIEQLHRGPSIEAFRWVAWIKSDLLCYMAVNRVTMVGRSNINMEYFSVSRETSYESLLDIVSRLVEANPSESSIKMKFIFNSPNVLTPFEVLNDDDVQYCELKL